MDPMNIIELRAENFKRLTAVRIKPSGKVVKIAGKNNQGKSSVLDSIFAALAGKDAIPSDPIHGGADTASIFVDLGEMRVTRKFKRTEEGDFTTTLLVENKDGSRPTSPQTLLTNLLGKYTLDPMEFARLGKAGQFDALKALVPGLDLDKLNAEQKADYERRTHQNRLAAELEAQAATIIVPAEKAVAVDVQPILDKLAGAAEENQKLQHRAQRRAKAEADVAAMDRAIKEHTERIAKLKADIADLEQAIIDATAIRDPLVEALAKAEPLPEPVDTAALTKALGEAQAANKAVEAQTQREELLTRARTHKEAAEKLTAAMAARVEHKNAAIAAAKFPVPGLTLGEEEVLIDGHPFVQAGKAQQIRTSIALAMALNPTIKVIRIMDGSLLDSDAMKIVAEMAEEHGFQVWVELVSEDGKAGIIIEDGHIKEA